MRVTVAVGTSGRRAIAGPVVVAAVAFRHGTRCPVLRRSEDVLLPLSNVEGCLRRKGGAEKQRLLDEAAAQVKEACIDHRTFLCSAAQLRKEGREAILSAMYACVRRLLERVSFEDPQVFDNHKVVEGTGSLSDPWQAHAARFVARQHRTEQMCLLHETDNRFSWDTNHGYATPEHLSALTLFGTSPHHRKNARSSS